MIRLQPRIYRTIHRTRLPSRFESVFARQHSVQGILGFACLTAPGVHYLQFVITISETA